MSPPGYYSIFHHYSMILFKIIFLLTALAMMLLIGSTYASRASGEEMLDEEELGLDESVENIYRGNVAMMKMAGTLIVVTILMSNSYVFRIILTFMWVISNYFLEQGRA